MNNTNENNILLNYKFQKLTPNNDIDLGIYERAINHAFEDPDIRNVAISGSYGAGKSSVIETYKEKQKNVSKKKFLHISLAHFEKVSEDEIVTIDDWDNARRMETRLEGKIINQLVHQIDPKKIPLTNFKVKREVGKFRIWLYTAWCTSFISLLLFIIFNGKWKALMKVVGGDKILRGVLISEKAILYAGIVLFLLSIIGISVLIKLQLRKKFLKRVNIQGNEIEIMEECEDSYFDRYLNEVLYLFENVDANAIVFEDIDRFGGNGIFVKIREINTLLKNRGKNIVFFYLLKDDLFASKDRTKFFDLIIPVIPVMDASNAIDKFIEVFETAGMKGLFEENFLRNMSLYIDDMRIVYNIQNEFVIYYAWMSKETGLNWSRLLAMIAYKNLFPKDFADLQMRKGYVYSLISGVEHFRDMETEKLEEQIESLKVIIERVEREVCKKLEELEEIYVEENNYSDYINKKSSVRRSGFAEKEKYERQIENLEDKKNTIRYQSLKELINAQNRDVIFSNTAKNTFVNKEEKFEDVKKSPYFGLIIYLISEGYIDETYPDYMTYFYGKSITAGDKKFLRSMLEYRELEYTYPIHDPAYVMSRVQDKYLQLRVMFNYDLMDFLLENADDYRDKLNRVVRGISMFQPDDFICTYIEQGKYRRAFAKALNEEDSGLTIAIMNEEPFSQLRAQYVIDMMCACGNTRLLEIDREVHLKAFIEEHPEILKVAVGDVDAVWTALQLLEVNLKRVEYENINIDLFMHIYQNNAYELNEEMVKMILENVYNVKPTEIDWANMLSVILHRDGPLEKYVRSKIGDYVKYVLEKTGIILDNEDVVAYVLNEQAINREDKLDYMLKCATKLEDIGVITDEALWPNALRHGIIKESLNNVCVYYFRTGRGIDDDLKEFINHSTRDMGKDRVVFDVAEVYGEEKRQMFIDELEELEGELDSEKRHMLLEALGMALVNGEFYVDTKNNWVVS